MKGLKRFSLDVLITMTCLSLYFAVVVNAEEKRIEDKSSELENTVKIVQVIEDGSEMVFIPMEEIVEASPVRVIERAKPVSRGTTNTRNVPVNGTSGNNGFVYSSAVPMPVEHQQYLWNKCIEHNLDYTKTLAVISLESSFNPNNISRTNDYGYMQINKGNHANLAKTLGTKNIPLDPYINITWGTHMLGNLYKSYQGKYSGNTLDEAVLSAYNKGVGGFNKHGFAKSYIKIWYSRLADLKAKGL